MAGTREAQHDSKLREMPCSCILHRPAQYALKRALTWKAHLFFNFWVHTNLKVNDVVAVHVQAVEHLPALVEPLVQVVEAQQQLVEAAGAGLLAASLLLQQAAAAISAALRAGAASGRSRGLPHPAGVHKHQGTPFTEASLLLQQAPFVGAAMVTEAGCLGPDCLHPSSRLSEPCRPSMS